MSGWIGSASSWSAKKFSADCTKYAIDIKRNPLPKSFVVLSDVTLNILMAKSAKIRVINQNTSWRIASYPLNHVGVKYHTDMN